MKSASRRFLVCFRPVELESGDLDGGDGSSVFEYAQVKNKEEEEALCGPPKRSSRRFSKALKSVLFDNSLSKSFRSSSSRISVEAAENALNRSETINPSSSSGSFSSSSSHNPPPGGTPIPPAVVPVNRNENMTNVSCFNSGLCILLVSLALTVVWGRLFAIAFTLIWLYSFSRRNSRLVPPSERAAERQEMVDSWGYKKRVIMEGLLERNHRHRSH